MRSDAQSSGARSGLAAVVVTTIAAVLFALASFYAALRWNLGIYFALAGYVLGQGVRLRVARVFDSRRPESKSWLLWDSLAMLAVALSLVGGLVLSTYVNLIVGEPGPLDSTRYRLNNLFALVLLILVIVGRWKHGRMIRRLKESERRGK